MTWVIFKKKSLLSFMFAGNGILLKIFVEIWKDSEEILPRKMKLLLIHSIFQSNPVN